MSNYDAVLLPGVPVAHVLNRLAKAGGNEVESGKLASPESSAALGVNTFGWFVEQPLRLPSFPGLEHIGVPRMVDVEYCARFPWPGGRHPWLDAVIETDTHLVGVESKRYEPYRDPKKVNFSDAYWRPCWGERMGLFERLRDRLSAGEARFDHLDACQLVKHAFGLVTDARRRHRTPVLVYAFAEPMRRGDKEIDSALFSAHREEITRFTEEVRGAEVEFAAVSYREWLATWRAAASDVAAHAAAIQRAFEP